MKLTSEVVQALKEQIRANAGSEYNSYVARIEERQKVDKRPNINHKPPMSFERWCSTHHGGVYLTANDMIEILNCADAGLEGNTKIEGPLTAEQQNDFYKRYFSEAVGEVGDKREAVYCKFMGYGNRGPDTLPTDEHPANLITSKVSEDKHMPAFDIDMPARLVPSKTKGHYHLMIDKEMSWSEYQLLLQALVIVGVVEKGYAEASITRGYSGIRVGPEDLVAQEIMKDVKYSEMADVFAEDQEGAIITEDAVKFTGDPMLTGEVTLVDEPF